MVGRFMPNSHATLCAVRVPKWLEVLLDEEDAGAAQRADMGP